jgi:CRISPR-associated protein Cas1
MRIVDLSEEPAGLSVKNAQLVIRREEQPDVTLPLEELVALVVSHPAVHYTHAALAGVCANGGAVILCNEKRLPIGMLLPLVGHFTQTERFAAQAEAALPTKKQLWRQVIRAKILAQAHTLRDVRGEDFGLVTLARKVRSGDPENLEGQASRKYWPALCGDEFHRVPGGVDPMNRLLNYGYAILRGVTARAICATGLHPSLGIHHHNRYNPFCLADDIMEPFRPLVDRQAVILIDSRGPETPLDKESKTYLIGAIMAARYTIDKESRTLFDTLAHVSASLAGVFTGERRRIILPEV